MFSSNIYFSEYPLLSSNFRRIHTVEFKLEVGKRYTPEQLIAHGYTLRKITLEGILPQEVIPEDEEFVIYEVKNFRPYGEKKWLIWDGRLLGDYSMRKLYEELMYEHAKLDVSLIMNEIPPDKLSKVDVERHKLHCKLLLIDYALDIQGFPLDYHMRELQKAINRWRDKVFIYKQIQYAKEGKIIDSFIQFCGDKVKIVIPSAEYHEYGHYYNEGEYWKEPLLVKLFKYVIAPSYPEDPFSFSVNKKRQFDYISGATSSRVYLVTIEISFHKKLLPLIIKQIKFLYEQIKINNTSDITFLRKIFQEQNWEIPEVILK